MKVTIRKTRNAWRHAYEINMDGDTIAWINSSYGEPTVHTCSSPLEALDAILDPIAEDKKFPNFEEALRFCIETLTRWSVDLTSGLHKVNLNKPKMEYEEYVPSAGAMYGA